MPRLQEGVFSTKQTWNLGVSEVPFDAITNHMMEFLKKCYGGVYEDSKRDREVVIQWFKTIWRGLRGGTIEYGRVHRDRSKNLKEKVQEICSRTDEILVEFKKVQREVGELRDEVLALRKKVIHLEILSIKQTTESMGEVHGEGMKKGI